MKTTIAFVVVATLIVQCYADCYLQNPRGSNNRLNEKSANRNNGNRLFDSQNNNRGGYNVGDKNDAAFNGNNPTGTLDATYALGVNNNDNMQYPMLYLENSQISMEWTVQHGCGGNETSDPHKLNCDMILQYMCDTEDTVVTDRAMRVGMRDGGNTNRPDAPNANSNANGVDTQANQNANNNRGRHESEGYYHECQLRERNKGLFTADQKLQGSTAKYTRQNPGGTRRGLECPEERDYYPYWHPTPWIDIAILTDDLTRCPSYLAGSQNQNPSYKCTDPDGQYTKARIEANNPADCAAAGGAWTTFAAKGIAAPACEAAEWSRVNHLGNVRGGQPATYNWSFPQISTLPTMIKRYSSTEFGAEDLIKCVVRVRYNISTDDYDPYNTDASSNENKNAGIRSPVENNPTVDVGADYQGLRLAINTNQFGRTFQDRSHIFYVKTKNGAFNGGKMYNLNVRGKRGNIVQTFPATEYDFQPSRLQVTGADFVHFQWTGSNTHNNGNPAGDGQAGDAGEGTGGTDRHNVVQTLNPDDNYPLPLDKYPNHDMFSTASCYNVKGEAITSKNCALILATNGYYRSTADFSTKPQLDVLLNNAYASFVQGIVVKFTNNANTNGTYNYISTRNNNFSNRSQKGSIQVL